MEITNDMLKKLSEMSDRELKEAIATVADAIGAGPMQKRMAVGHAALLRKKILNASESELSTYLAKLSPEKQAELKQKLKL